MCLATAEVCLQVHYRLAAVAGQPLEAIQQETPESFCEEGAPEELEGELVLVTRFAAMHLAEIRSELCHLVLARRDIPVGCDDIPPRTQAGSGLTFHGDRGRSLLLSTRLLFIAGAHQLLLVTFYLRRLVGCAGGCEQPPGGVESAIGVVRA